MKYFQHHNAATIEQALSLMERYNGQARIIAGGTDLLGTLKADILPHYPEALINIKTIPGMDSIQEVEDGLRIGPLTKLAGLAQSPVIRRGYRILAEAAESVASPEIRNMATIGGNLCQETRCWYYRYPHNMGGRIICFRKGKGPCPAIAGDNRYHAILEGKKCVAVCPSDMAVALCALNAGIEIRGPEGRRTLPVEDFYETLGTVLKPNDLLTGIRVPKPRAGTRQVFYKHRVRDSVDFAIVSVAAALTVNQGVCRQACIVLGAVAPTPYRARQAEDLLAGGAIDDSTAGAAAEAAVGKAKPLSRNAYKIDIAKALVKRAIREAAAAPIQ